MRIHILFYDPFVFLNLKTLNTCTNTTRLSTQNGLVVKRYDDDRIAIDA